MKYCESCGQALEDSALFCTTCGERQNKDNDTTEQSVKQQEVSSVSEKKSKKKIIIPIIFVVALLIIGLVVYFVFFAGKDKDNEVVEDNNLGITVDGEFYEFTVEEGIKDYNDIQGGVVYQSEVSDAYYLKFRPDGEEKSVDIDQLDTLTWVHLEPFDMDGNKGMIFYFREGYEIDGLTGFSTEEEIREAGYISWMSHQMIATENGNVDVYDYMDDCMRVYEEGTFDVTPYMLDVAEGSPESRRSKFIIEDDVDGFFEYYVEGFEAGMTDDEFRKHVEECPDVLNIFAYTDVREQFSNGEIEIVIFKDFTLVPEDRKDVEHLLRVHVYAQGDAASKWEASWK